MPAAAAETRVDVGAAASFAWLQLPRVSAALAARREQALPAKGRNGSVGFSRTAALELFSQILQNTAKTLFVFASENSREGFVFPGWHRLAA